MHSASPREGPDLCSRPFTRSADNGANQTHHAANRCSRHWYVKSILSLASHSLSIFPAIQGCCAIYYGMSLAGRVDLRRSLGNALGPILIKKLKVGVKTIAACRLHSVLTWWRKYALKVLSFAECHPMLASLLVPQSTRYGLNMSRASSKHREAGKSELTFAACRSSKTGTNSSPSGN